MPVTEYTVVVVGAGVEGSSVSYQLVKNGIRRVLLLEQFHTLHSRGSSHGGSRLTRKSPTQPESVNAMFVESARFYEELSERCGKELYTSTNLVSFGRKNCPLLKHTADSMKQEGVSHPLISAEEMNRRFPHQVSLPEDFHCIWDTRSTSILSPTQILATFQRLFVSGGGVLLDNHCVTDILPEGNTVTVRTNRGDFISQKVIITAGGWAPKLLRKLGVELPVKVQRAEVLYWRVDCPEHFSFKNFPILVYEDLETMDKFYIFPEYEYPGLIKAYYRTSRSIDPDYRDEGGAGPESVEKVVQFIKTYLKGVCTTPAIFEPCIYSLTPDYLPIVDSVPSHSNIMFAAGLSGIGFKLAPAIGQVFTEMTLGRPLSFDISPLRLARFPSHLPNKAKL